MPANATKVRLFSVAASVYLSFCFFGSSLYANAIMRSDFFAISSFCFIRRALRSFVRSTFRPLMRTPVHLSRTACGAPFVRVNISREWRCLTTTDMRLRIESKGSFSK